MSITISLGIALFMGFLIGYLSARIRLSREIDHYRIGADVQEKEFQALFQKYINLHAKITADPDYRPLFL